MKEQKNRKKTRSEKSKETQKKEEKDCKKTRVNFGKWKPWENKNKNGRS